MYITYKNAEIFIRRRDSGWDIYAVFNSRPNFPVKTYFTDAETIKALEEYVKYYALVGTSRKSTSARKRVYELCRSEYHNLYGRVKPKLR